ncbi:MAG: translocation/assembly module TamB domain-containing protein, partial [Acidobacteriota bacterium]|nr:translocation/assembly module TamB domain-containing protein [Acidobacteriota bacterium]
GEENGSAGNGAAEEDAPRRGRFLTRRNFFISLTLIVGAILVLVLAGFLVYRFGYFDNYVKNQFITKMDQIGITFSADTFRTTIAPMTLELGNATFVDKKTGERLFRIDKATLGLSVTDLYAWQLSRDFRVDSTDVDGAEVWIRFDENGNSNFSNLEFVEEERGYVNFNYTSLRFSLQNGLIHFGDVQRRVSADARNVLLTLEPENPLAPDEQKRYRFDFTSTKSTVVYDERPIDPVDVRVRGLAYREGAEIAELRLTSPLGDSTLTGNIEGWQEFRYNFRIDSTLDLTQTGTIFASGTALRGITNFRGTVAGEGERYTIDGEVTSDALAASNVRLKALQATATVNVNDGIYDANGKAIAEMLTLEDFRIDFPQLIGNVRGNGSDFKWFGELQAASAKSPYGTIASLYISDALAEYKDEQQRLDASFGTVTARRFFSEEAEIEFLRARNARLTYINGNADVSLPNVSADNVKVEGAQLRGVNAGNLKVRSRNGRTDIQASSLQAQNLQTGDANLRNVSASGVNVTTNGTTRASVDQLRAGEVNAQGARIGNLNASNVDIEQIGNETRVNSDRLQVGSIATNAAVLGSLNIAGVRLSIREGRVEGTSGDIDAGNVNLRNQGNLENVRLAKPVFVLEPSGRYRASLDMSLGGGVLGSIRLGAARASVIATNEEIALNNLTASVMDGNLNGNAVIALTNRRQSRVDAEFAALDLSKLLALQGGRVIPIAGQTTGRANLTFPGTNIRAASGSLTADFVANAGTAERGLVPVNGRLELTATNGLFDIQQANLNTEKSALTATGRFDLEGYNSNLNLALNSTDASEIERLINVLNLSPELQQRMAANEIQLAGNATFSGTLTGNLTNPTIDGRAALDSILIRGRNLGSLASNVFVSPETIDLRDGRLLQPDGGNIAFSVSLPQTGTNNGSVQATLTRVNTGNLLAALPIELPEALRDFQGETSGTINLSGLPQAITGEANIVSNNAVVAGQAFDNFEANLSFQNSIVNINKFEGRSADGFLRANGTYDTNSTAFNLDVEGRGLQLARLRTLFTKSPDFPAIGGTIDLRAQATGRTADATSYNINFTGTGQNVSINENAVGSVSFTGNTVNQQLNANLTATLGNQPQTLTASVNFADPNLPIRAETTFNNTELAPYIALFRPPDGVAITGTATGRVFLEGNLYATNARGERVFSTENLRGSAEFTQFGLHLNETPFTATNPLVVRFNGSEVTVEDARFSGAGSNLVINGTKSLNAAGTNNLTVEGTINLRVLDVLSPNTFFAGIANLSVRVAGSHADARLTGTARLENASVSTFMGNERLNFNRINGRVLFTSNQAQIEQVTGYLGGGQVVISGGALLEGLQLERFRLDLRGTNVTAPVQDFIATADADISISGGRRGNAYESLIAGRILARRVIYNKDIDLADIIGRRTQGSISQGTGGGSFLGVTRLALTIQGENALVVRNNLANLTGSADLTITGDTETPVIAGRITANSGTIFFRNDRYEVQRGTLEFPAQPDRAPFINLQAETEIQGYQIFVNLLGELSDFESLNATVRSNPALPQADVVSLITSGNLANTGDGIPTLAQTGINTAAEILADALINNPARKATDKLFGLNRFEIDPILSGVRSNPTARLTVGRQINRNLLITYSTNLSEDQNQVLALEYRVSNRLSFVAQYEQGSTTNVTRSRDNFSFEIRLRKRF